MTGDAERRGQWMRRMHDPGQMHEWTLETNLIHSALAGVGLIMVQPFLTSAGDLDPSATVCVIAFAVAIPCWRRSS